MAEQSEQPVIPLVIERSLAALLEGLHATGAPPARQMSARAEHGWLAVFFVGPAPTYAPYLTECEWDCLWMLSMAHTQGKAVASAHWVCAHLEADHKRVWGENTVKQALKHLVELGLVVGSTQHPKGYRLAGADVLKCVLNTSSQKQSGAA